jgi:hypothetical protein
MRVKGLAPDCGKRRGRYAFLETQWKKQEETNE